MKKILLSLIFISNLIIAQTTPDLGQVLEVDNNGYQLGISNINNIIGGTSTTSSLTFKTTTGVGTTGADHIFQVGNNGATEAMRITNVGNVSTGAFSTANQRVLQFNQNTSYGSLGSLVGLTSWGALYLDAASPSLTNYSLAGDGSTTVLNGLINGSINVNNNNRLVFLGAVSTGASVSTTIIQPSNTNQTLSTDISGFKYIGGSRQWATGAIATQRENLWEGTTYTAVGASVITNAYNTYLNSPIASTNVTITNNYGLGVHGKMAIGLAGLVDTRAIDIKGSGTTAFGHIGSFSNGLYLTNNYFYDGSQNYDAANLGGCRILLYSAATTGSYISFGTATAGTALPSEHIRIDNSGNLGIGLTTMTAKLHLKAGTTAASTAPLKFTSGALNTTAETGAIEFLTDAWYGTITTGAARKTFAFLESPTFTGTPSMPTGTIGITQSANDNSTKLATTAYVDAAIDVSTIIYEASVTIISAEILNLYTTPKVVSITVGSGKYVEVISASATMTYNSIPYATNTNLIIACVGANAYTFSDNNILQSTVTRNTQFSNSTSALLSTNSQLVDNANLEIRVENGNPTAGNSNIKVKILFRIVTI